MTLPVVLLLAACAATLWIAGYARQRAPLPGQRSFVAMHLAGAWWAGCVALEAMAPMPDAKLFWAEMAWPGMIAAPSFWAIFLRSYLHGPMHPRWSRMTLGLAALAWALALTNEWHHLIYHSALSITPPCRWMVRRVPRWITGTGPSTSS